MDQMRKSELDSFLAQHPELTPEQRDQFDQCTKAMLAKWLHQPIVELKTHGAVDRDQLKMIASMFGLPESALPQTPLYVVPKAGEA